MVGRSVELYTENDEEEVILRYISISLQEGIFSSDGNLMFGRDIQHGTENIGFFNFGYLYGISNMRDANATLMYEAICVFGHYIET